MDRVLITGGAGFIGSHMIDRIIDDCEIIVLDDLSAGDIENINPHKDKKGFTFVKGSITSKTDIEKAMDGVDTVFHFAAQPDVRLSVEKPYWDFEINVAGSILLLDQLRKHDVKRFIFASSGGTVYGETDVFPTPEATAFRPISNYGAAKGSMEMYMSSYAALYDIDSVSMRLGNVIGPRLTHGVIYDFFMKMKRDPTRLEVLGDGQQEKSYLYVGDAVEAAYHLGRNMRKGYTPVNVSSGDRLKVSRIAKIILEELELQDAKIEYTGEERGWKGDVVKTDVSIELLKSFGWTPQVSLEEGVKRCVIWLKEKFGI